MSDAPTSRLERQLDELTAWHGPVPGLWRQALATAGPPRAAGSPSSILRQPVSGWLVGGLAAVALIAVAILVTLPSTSRARVAARSSGMARPAPQAPAHVEHGLAENSFPSEQDLATLGYVERDSGTSFGGGGKGAGRVGAPAQGTPGESEPALERQVIRKATIELKAQDVRAVFLKASQLLSEARGEYIQDSSLTGEGAHTEANLTLRIAAERLPEVLNELRQLGEVRSEKIAGEDVTSQVVDLQARLRNEQRVEAELLNLLESRKNSPLKEILELRSSISGVRQTIERLTAQRDRFGRLVSLATVLVIIRPADAPAPPPPKTGLWSHFGDAFQRACENGTLFLVNTLAGLVSVLIGGLVWWVLLIVAILIVRAYRRRTRPSA
jgi:hypothetical protein